MLRRLGAEVLHAPTMATVHTDPVGRLRAVTEALVAEPPDVVVANTGLGMRSWLAAAADWGLDGALLGALGHAEVTCRGPKAAGAVRSAGLAVAWRAPDEQLDTVVAHLLERGVGGARVALQLHGSPSPAVVARLRAAGAEVVEVPVYHWTLPEDGAPAAALVEACVAGEVDAVTFTAGPQVRNLLELAERAGRAGVLLEALSSRVLVACIGPVCAAVARDEGIADPAVPEHWRLGSLVKLVADRLAPVGDQR